MKTYEIKDMIISSQQSTYMGKTVWNLPPIYGKDKNTDNFCLAVKLWKKYLRDWANIYPIKKRLNDVHMLGILVHFSVEYINKREMD